MSLNIQLSQANDPSKISLIFIHVFFISNLFLMEIISTIISMSMELYAKHVHIQNKEKRKKKKEKKKKPNRKERQCIVNKPGDKIH